MSSEHEKAISFHWYCLVYRTSYFNVNKSFYNAVAILFFFTFPFHSDKYVETETIVATATYVMMQYVLLIDNNSLSFRLLFVERTKNSKSVIFKYLS